MGEANNCLVNSRVGDCVDADYFSLGDCEVPDFNTGADFETPMTICDAWGYNNMPGNLYRDAKEMIRQLVDIVSLGGNYLLNVGPDACGVIPTEARERLEEIGMWMRVNGESIYGTKASPFPAKPSWGRITAKDDALYLHVYEWNETITLTGIKAKVTAVHMLADPQRAVAWVQEPCGSLGYDKLSIRLQGSAPDESASVLKVRFDRLQAETGIIEDDSGCITLPACLAEIHSTNSQPCAKVLITGVVKDWLSVEDGFSWDFICEHPGEFDVSITISSGYHGVWDFGHRAVVECGDQEIQFGIEDSGIPTDHFQKRTIVAGRIRINSVGMHRLSIKAQSLSCSKGHGFQLSAIKLQPTPQ